MVVGKPSDSKVIPKTDTQAPRKVPIRSVVVGILIALILCAITPYNDYYVAATYLAGNFFPVGAMGAVLLIVLVFNPICIRLGRRRWAFSSVEIVTVWSIITVVSGIPSSGLMRYLIPHMVAPHYYANPVNGWQDRIISHQPSRLFVTDPVAVRAFFEGLHRGEAIPWSAWLVPLCWWGIFVALLFTSFFCLSAILRRQWVENERLSFPLVQLPIALAEAPEAGFAYNKLVRSPVLWWALSIDVCLHTVKGLHLFFPRIPDLPMVWNSSTYLTTLPWSGLNDIMFAVYPLVIGFAFLIASDVCLSLWLFYVLFKLQCLIGIEYNWNMSMIGVGYSMCPAFVSYEEAGGFVMMALLLFWAMRPHLRDVWRKAVFGAVDVDDRREPMPYRWALFGLLGAYVGMYAWMTVIAQVEAQVAFVVLAMTICIFLTLSWLVAQGGLLFIHHAFSTTQTLTVVEGTQGFNAPALGTAMIVEHVGWQDAREFMLPSLLNAQKAASELGQTVRALTPVLAISVVLAVIVSGAASIWLPYTHGGGSSLQNRWAYVNTPQIPYEWTTSIRQSPVRMSVSHVANVIGGALFVLMISLCRVRFPWFQLHPAGFLAAGTWAMYTLWFSLMIGWFLKSCVLRFGGMYLYRRFLPAFLGLIIGDCLSAIAWTIVGLITHTGYLLLPN